MQTWPPRRNGLRDSRLAGSLSRPGSFNRAIYRLSRGRKGLWRPEAEPLGDDAPHHGGPPLRQEAQRDPRLLRGWSHLVTMAMNGWKDAEPPGGSPASAPRRQGRAYRWHARHPWAGGPGRGARAPLGRWREMGDDVDGYATRRPSGTAVVVLEPRSVSGEPLALRAH